MGTDFGLNQTIFYQCPEGHRVVGDQVRTCQETGFWSGVAPTCQCECWESPELGGYPTDSSGVAFYYVCVS